VEVWAGLPADVPLRDVGAMAARAEAIGFDGLHVPETVHDSFIVAQLAAATTERLLLRTSVALAFPRSPMITAIAAWDVQDLAGGRFQLGIGTQVRGNIEGRFSVPWSDPVGRIGDYVDALQAIFEAFTTRGELHHEGPHYRFTRLQPYFNPGPVTGGAPPIWLGGVGPKMWHLAGARAAGIVTHPTNSDPLYLRDVCLPALRAGEVAAGRPAGRAQVMVGTSMITGRDNGAVAAERERQRQLLAFLYSTPAYRPALEARGLAGVHERLHHMSLQKQWDDLAHVLTDAIVDQLVPCAPYAELAGVLKDRYGGWVDGLRLTLPPDPSDDELIAAVVAQLR
jgi:probable F420-dependent oxidoreductase